MAVEMWKVAEELANGSRKTVVLENELLIENPANKHFQHKLKARLEKKTDHLIRKIDFEFFPRL